MKAIKILKNHSDINWNYNEETDIFYISTRTPQAAISIEIAEGLIAYYDESQKEVIGLSLEGLRAKVLKRLTKELSLVEEVKRLAKLEQKAVEDERESIAHSKQLFDYGGEA